jgi:hypothetical protein
MNRQRETSPPVVVLEATTAKIRTFLYELAEGTTNYRSLHSLTAQVEHQYHGRFLIELIQNAHDALERASPSKQPRGRIALIYEPEEGPFGTLYAANDGRPFTKSNFENISQLGRSDKDPQESIGNKGIGFRSVLEICQSPEIYSRSHPSAEAFDGYCFRFSPQVVNALKGPVKQLAAAGAVPLSPFGNVPLVDWDEVLISKYRATVRRRIDQEGSGWLDKEVEFLSPYLLPQPLERPGHKTVRECERAGYATIVRLPLKDAVAQGSVQQGLDGVDSLTMLFLERAATLVLRSGDRQRTLTRKAEARSRARTSITDVVLAEKETSGARKYTCWTKTFPVGRDEVLKKAVAALPGRWPELREVAISICIRSEATAEEGTFSIFLPTTEKSGSYAHVNAPFFGGMSRKDIDFSEPYNARLLDLVGELVLDVLTKELAGKGVPEARGCLDLLSGVGESEAAKRWTGLLDRTAENAGKDLNKLPLFLSDRGWRAIADVSIIPEVDGANIVSGERLRKSATFAVLHVALASRAAQFWWLSENAGLSAEPMDEDLANTIEVVAETLHREQSRPDWNGFWGDVQNLLPGKATALRGKKVLLGTDECLHASGPESAIFFQPRRGSGDGDELADESALGRVPEQLQRRLAFLSHKIRIYDEKDPRAQTSIRKYLDSSLVSRFRVEDIVRNVLVPAVPKLPARLGTQEERTCRAILLWGLDLVAPLLAAGKGESSVKLLSKLPVPCRGGWFPLEEAMFGPAWPQSIGDDTLTYLEAVDSKASRQLEDRLLLPPTDVRWNKQGDRYRPLLIEAGVFDGLRLCPTSTEATLYSSRYYSQLPDLEFPDLSSATWGKYKQTVGAKVRSTYERSMPYQVQSFSLIPGLDRSAELPKDARLALMNVLFRSIHRWTTGWDMLEARKVGGHYDVVRLQSPLAFMLTSLSWIGVESERGSLVFKRPGEWWHVPASAMAGRAWHFAHLSPLPIKLARQLDADAGLASALHKLGLPKLDEDAETSDPRLLKDLVNAVARGEIPDRNVMVGQLRSAWAAFFPRDATNIPESVVCLMGGRLVAIEPAQKTPIFIPDALRAGAGGLDQFDLPVLAIEPPDARRLASVLSEAFGEGAALASELELVPYVEGQKWRLAPAQRMRDSTLDWVIPLVLTVAAYSGARTKGTGSRRFRELVDWFRAAEVEWTQGLTVSLTHGGRSLAKPVVAALWLPAAGRLLVSNACQKEPRLLADALATMLDRDDLEVALAHCLDSLTSLEPDDDEILEGLKRLKLTEGHYSEVRALWRGDLGRVLRLIAPLVALLRPEADSSRLLELDTEEGLVSELDRLSDARFSGKGLLELARECPDAFQFGYEAHARYGLKGGLPDWNAALKQHDERVVKNPNAQIEFAQHLRALRPLLRAFLAALIKKGKSDARFGDVAAELEAIGCPDEIASRHWTVPMRAAVEACTPLLKMCGASGEQIAQLGSAENIDECERYLRGLHVDTTKDPALLHQANAQKIAMVARRFAEIGLAWAVKERLVSASNWQERATSSTAALTELLATDGYLRELTEEDIINVLRALPHESEANLVWDALSSIHRIEALISTLKLEPGDLESAAARLEALKVAQEERKRQVEVCGRPFQNRETNLGALWAHICSAIPDKGLLEIAKLQVSDEAVLEDVVARSPRGSRKRSQNEPSDVHPRLSKSMEELIGLSGEIHAYRFLQAAYGAQRVGPSCWISGNSLHVFPGNASDDAKGCDFILEIEGKTYHIEVKASLAEDESFRLGSSEIRLAVDMSKTIRRRQKQHFKILHVLNALSKRPKFRVLPNPYDQRYEGRFFIEEADARIRYISRD